MAKEWFNRPHNSSDRSLKGESFPSPEDYEIPVFKTGAKPGAELAVDKPSTPTYVLDQPEVTFLSTPKGVGAGVKAAKEILDSINLERKDKGLGSLSMVEFLDNTIMDKSQKQSLTPSSETSSTKRRTPPKPMTPEEREYFLKIEALQKEIDEKFPDLQKLVSLRKRSNPET